MNKFGKSNQKTSGETMEASCKTKYTDNVVRKKSFIKNILAALRESTWLKPEAHSVDYDNIYQAFLGIDDVISSCFYKDETDILVVENVTESERDSITLRGIVVRTNVTALLTDPNFKNYMELVDFFYIAVPDNPKMINVADSIRQPKWGIMTVDQFGNIYVIREPLRLTPVYREKSLTNAIMKFAGTEINNIWCL